VKSHKQRAFLAAFRLTASLTKAAEAAKCPRTLHYRWLDDATYMDAFETAKEEAGQSLEDEAIRRAHEGVLVPVFYKGKATGVQREFSDAVLMFLLKGFKPDKYRERGSVELTGAGGGPIEIVERLNAARKRRDEDK
jgi:hypothetical protein